MARKLSEKFEKDLLDGCLKELLDYVKSDNSLDLEIREGYINIYYRGGNILMVKEKSGNKNCNYSFFFDKNYFRKETKLSFDHQKCLDDKDWFMFFPLAKRAMDFFFTWKKKEEREVQQLTVRDNNYSTVAAGTDYFVVDIEYSREGARFDVVAVEWISEGIKRRLLGAYKPKLVVFELKYGDGALSGSAGIEKHLADFSTFLSDEEAVKEFKQEMLDAFSQKRRLGLIPPLSEGKNKNAVVEFADEIEFVFLLANHDPASSKLRTAIGDCDSFFAKFIVSNFSGYGLYKHNLFSCEEFVKRFSNQIYDPSFFDA